ncbi:MAG: DUF1643 domain-containing protein [Bacteroidetes bacterium]|nr:DUF1643 domain-containing protein [Bacteroidota bacterium]
MYTKSDFLSANELKQVFSVTGYFYSTGKVKCRKHLNIKLKTSKKKKPDLMVVMMNPGSSKPLNDTPASYNKETPAKPDPTQYKIMRFMLQSNYEYARVLNLSDLIQATSSKFYKSISKKSKDNNHSIFHPTRTKELKDLFEKNIPTLIAWGVNDDLQPLIDLSYKYITTNSNFFFGYKKEGALDRYLHPQTRDSGVYARWLNEVLASYQIKKSQQS